MARRMFGFALLPFALLSASANAGFIEDVGFGLGFAGFNIQGQHNVLSGGDDFLINTNFQGNPLDFGAAELTLNGPISLGVSTSNRILPTIDIDFTTALNGRQNASPLSYSWVADVGSQTTQIDGSLLLDGRLSVNSFGFYDLEFTYSSRQSVTRDGRFADDTQTHDGDVGPINISGNIIADALAAITDPIFEAAGATNPFASFSGSAKLREILQSTGDPSSSSPALRGIEFDQPSLQGFGNVVPEPTALVLMVITIPVIAAKRRKNR